MKFRDRKSFHWEINIADKLRRWMSWLARTTNICSNFTFVHADKVIVFWVLCSGFEFALSHWEMLRRCVMFCVCIGCWEQKTFSTHRRDGFQHRKLRKSLLCVNCVHVQQTYTRDAYTTHWWKLYQNFHCAVDALQHQQWTAKHLFTKIMRKTKTHTNIFPTHLPRRFADETEGERWYSCCRFAL